MSEYTNDLYMQMYRNNQYTMFAVTAGVRAVVALVQFVARLQKEHILSGGEVEKLMKFVKATDGKYDIYNVPLMKGQAIDKQLGSIKEKLDRMQIRYHILPDVNDANNSIQICVFKDDLQRFQQFFGDYIQENLSGGVKDLDDLRNFTNGRTSIVSIPDEAFESMKGAMENLRVDYAPLPDLNLKDGEKQFAISNSSVQSMKQAYQLYREGLLKQGREVSEMHVMKSPKEYTDTAKISADEYMEQAGEKEKAAIAKYKDSEVTEKEISIDKLENTIKPADSPECALFLRSDDYCKLSIDEMTLVDNPVDPLPKQMEEKFPERFFCRIPGTYGDSEQILSVEKSHVFSIEDADRPRYLVFVDREEAPLVMVSKGKNGTRDLYKSGDDLYRYFDRFGKQANEREKSVMVGVKKDASWHKIHNFKEREYDWDAFERALLQKSYSGIGASGLTNKDVPVPPKVK